MGATPSPEQVLCASGLILRLLGVTCRGSPFTRVPTAVVLELGLSSDLTSRLGISIFLFCYKADRRFLVGLPSLGSGIPGLQVAALPQMFRPFHTCKHSLAHTHSHRHVHTRTYTHAHVLGSHSFARVNRHTHAREHTTMPPHVGTVSRMLWSPPQ